MDQLITIDEVVEFLKNTPLVSPRPDFAKVQALRKHIIKALKQLDCPQSLVHGWTGLVMDPVLYISYSSPTRLYSPYHRAGPPYTLSLQHRCKWRWLTTFCKEQELLLVVHEHQPCVLLHAWQNGSRPIQGLKYPQFDRVERVDVHSGRSWPVNGKLQHAQRKGSIQQWHIAPKSIPPHWGTGNAFLLHRAIPRDPNHQAGPIFPVAHHQCWCSSPNAVWHFPQQRIWDMGRHAK